MIKKEKKNERLEDKRREKAWNLEDEYEGKRRGKFEKTKEITLISTLGKHIIINSIFSNATIDSFAYVLFVKIGK